MSTVEYPSSAEQAGQWLCECIRNHFCPIMLRQENPRRVVVANTDFGQFLVYEDDRILGGFMRETHRVWGADDISRVTEFLPRTIPTWTPEFFVDVGANVGTHIIYAMEKLLFRAGTAIEPAPFNIDLLTCNVILHHMQSSVTIHGYALGNDEQYGTEATIEYSPVNFGDNRVNPAAHSTNAHGEQPWERGCVYMSTLNRLAKPWWNGTNTLVWIDAQGYDCNILHGASVLYDRKIPFVFEFWPYGLDRAGADIGQFADLLGSCSLYHVPSLEHIDDPSRALTTSYERLLHQESEFLSPHFDILAIPGKDV